MRLTHHLSLVVSMTMVLGAVSGCDKRSQPSRTAAGPAPQATAASPVAQPQQPPPTAAASESAQRPKARTGDPNLPGFIRPSAPVAIVNGKPIPAERFNREFDRLVGAGVRIPADRIKHIAHNILNRQVEQELRTQAIVRERIELTTAEFDEAWQAHLARYTDVDGSFDKAQFQSNLKRNGMVEDDLKQQVRRERLARKLVEKLGNIDVERAEMKAFYDQNASSWVERESRDVRPLLIAVPTDASDDTVAAALTKAKAVHKALQDGGDFETIAAQNGDTPRPPMRLTRNSPQRKLAEAAFKLNVGQVTKPVRGQWGFYVVRLLAKNPERARPYLEVKADIEKRIRERKIYLEGRRLLAEMRRASEITEKLPF